MFLYFATACLTLMALAHADENDHPEAIAKASQAFLIQSGINDAIDKTRLKIEQSARSMAGHDGSRFLAVGILIAKAIKENKVSISFHNPLLDHKNIIKISPNDAELSGIMGSIGEEYWIKTETVLSGSAISIGARIKW